MESADIVFVALAAVFMMVLGIGVKWWMRYMNRTTDWINHYVPIGDKYAAASPGIGRDMLAITDNAHNARLEAAMRDAELGFNVCATCGLENVEYRIFCVLCGSPVEKMDVGSPKNDDLPAQPLAPQKPRAPPPVGMQSQRQRRAQTRREWTRTLDGDGSIQWRRRDELVADKRRSVYIVEFSREYADLVAVEITEETKHEDDVAPPQSEHPTETTDHVDLLVPSAVSKQLTDDVQAFKMAIVPATNGTFVLPDFTPLQSRSQPSSSAVIDLNDVVAMAAEQPFPVRLAAFVTHVTMRQASYGCLSLKIERAELLDDSMDLLAVIPCEIVASNIRLQFLEEQGIDAGGVYREWFLLLNEAIVTPEAGVFTCADPQTRSFYLNPHSRELLGESHLMRFLATGRLLGRALLEGNVTGFHLAQPLLKIVLGQPVGFHDLEFFDPATHRSLQWLLDNDGVNALGLTFSVVEELPSGEMRVVELLPGGSDIDVTDANKHEFVDRKLQYLLFESVHDQLFVFLRGVYEVVPMELLMLFDAEELDYVLSGSDVIDVDDWETHTKFTADLIDHAVRDWFWQLVRAMPNEYRRRLLQFATGASRVPLAGFAALTSYDGRLCPFTLRGVALKHEPYIRSHACFNTLDLPRYRTKEQLEMMLLGVLDADIQGFTVA